MALAAALDRGVPVIPVVLDGLAVPPPEAFDVPLSRLVFRQALPLQNINWMSDVKRLLDLLSEQRRLPRLDCEVARASSAARAVRFTVTPSKTAPCLPG